MLPDLERLIRLQDLETRAERARAVIAAMPERMAELEARLAANQAALADAGQRLAEVQAARRLLEKDLAAAQGRLSRFKDQLMEVKTNKEYQAMQKEIAAAEHDVRSIEDKILESLLTGDDRAAEVKRAETELAAEQAGAVDERRTLERERTELEGDIARALADRGRVVRELSPDALSLYEQVARVRKGVAVAEAREGHCTICHVRLRPQVFNEIRRNESIIQCDSCLRILYYAAKVSHEPRRAEGT